MEETNIPQILKACRKKANMTQAQFAKTIGIKRSAYAYYESGRTRPKIETLRTIAKVYGIDVNELISNKNSDLLHQDQEQKINFDIKDFNDTFYDLSENEKAIIMKLRIMNREKRAKIINEIFE
ncbi:MAG: helix-turn-helix domain-containing protein [Eubacterium sp.]|nr:helix-turn-helix domain-containing protein [Eubacterium sp.]MDD6567764.1 helix-turn-helix domain-containing protein [Eubacteriales bacterium]MDY4110413.1 helix-turn-helix domain-containing protein [Eubacterium sp.]